MVKSELVVVHLTGLEQTSNLHCSLALLFLCFLRCFLAVFGEQVGIVAGELLELDEEVAKSQLEAVDVFGLLEKIGDETLDLRSGTALVYLSTTKKRRWTYVVRLGKALVRRFATKLDRNSRFDVPAGAMSEV